MPCFLDFEASSLSPNSFPIEIGICGFIQDEMWTWGSLIKPAATWDMDDWDPKSEAVHGIKREELVDAPSPFDVVSELLKRLEPFYFTVFSDYPKAEIRWLNMLLAEHSSNQKIEVLDFDNLVNQHFPTDQRTWERIYGYLDKHPAPHRADEDAERLAKAFQRGFS